MNKIIFAAIIALSSTAFGFGSDAETIYMSWCQNNQVITNVNNTNELKVVADCTREELTCVEKKVSKARMNHIYAICE